MIIPDYFTLQPNDLFENLLYCLRLRTFRTWYIAVRHLKLRLNTMAMYLLLWIRKFVYSKTTLLRRTFDNSNWFDWSVKLPIKINVRIAWSSLPGPSTPCFHSTLYSLQSTVFDFRMNTFGIRDYKITWLNLHYL